MEKHLPVFQNGTDRTTQAEVTRIWAALINQAEGQAPSSRGKRIA
ncbi:MAG: hypothetical protein ACLUD9_07480 [Anaerotignum faecicola]